MLTITIPEQEFFNPDTSIFYTMPPVKLKFEHSLLSVSKWESKMHKSFFSFFDSKEMNGKELNSEEFLYYIKCMCISDVKDNDFRRLTKYNYKEISDYISDSMTATTFSNLRKERKVNKMVTSELIYYWMVSCGIPFSTEKWHLNRLLTLIRVCEIENNKDNNKMSKKDLNKYNHNLNAARKAKYGTKG